MTNKDNGGPASDRELLEMAAKACGMTTHEALGKIGKPISLYSAWNPIEDDGDALRLAVTVGIEFHIEGGKDDEAVWANDVMIWADGNRLSATRRAIVRAAAAIGSAM